MPGILSKVKKHSLSAGTKGAYVQACAFYEAKLLSPNVRNPDATQRVAQLSSSIQVLDHVFVMRKLYSSRGAPGNRKESRLSRGERPSAAAQTGCRSWCLLVRSDQLALSLRRYY